MAEISMPKCRRQEPSYTNAWCRQILQERLLLWHLMENTIDEIILSLSDWMMERKELTMTQRWPIRVPRPVHDQYSGLCATGYRTENTGYNVSNCKRWNCGNSWWFWYWKTMTQHQIAKWSDADIIIYIGCGERGNEMTQVLEEFSAN